MQAQQIQINLSEAQSKIYLCENRFISVPSGRRFGKTFLIKELIRRDILKKDIEIVYIAPTHSMAKKLMYYPLFNEFKKFDYIKDKDKSDLFLHLKNGAKIHMGGGKAYDRWRGPGYDGVYFDETADIPYECWSEVIRAAISDKQGFAYFLGTPKGLNNWFYDMSYSDDVEMFHFTTLEGGNVAIEEIEAARKMLDARTFKQEFEASFESYSNLAYYCFDNESLIDIEFNRQAHSWLCFDFNASEKPMSVALIQEIEKDKHAVVKEFVYPHTNTETICQIISDYLTENQFESVLKITGDYAGGATKTVGKSDYLIIEHYFKNYLGYDIIKRPTKRIRDRVGALNSCLRALDGTRKLFVNKDCKALINDFRKVDFKDNGRELDGSNPLLTHISDAVSYWSYNVYPIDFDKVSYYDF